MADKGIYMFLSFDLAGSTKFKEEYPWLWADFFTSYHDAFIQYVQQTNSQVRLWKLLGDEVLAYRRVERAQEIFDGLQMTQEILEAHTFIKTAKDKCLQKISKRLKIPMSLDEIAEIIDNRVACKVTMWIAACSPEAEGGENILYNRRISDEWQMLDFLGHDIDEGFRIAKYARRGRILVSPLLAWLAWQGARKTGAKQSAEDSFRIVSYTTLKGVWEERKYPLVMYWRTFEDLHKELEYDELDSAPYEGMAGRKWEDYMADELYHVSQLDHILTNVGQIQKAQAIFAMMGE